MIKYSNNVLFFLCCRSEYCGHVNYSVNNNTCKNIFVCLFSVHSVARKILWCRTKINVDVHKCCQFLPELLAIHSSSVFSLITLLKYKLSFKIDDCISFNTYKRLFF